MKYMIAGAILMVLIGDSGSEPLSYQETKPKPKPKETTKDWIKLTGIGVIRKKQNEKGVEVEGLEVLVGKDKDVIAYEITFPNKSPLPGLLISFTGNFDGHVVSTVSWSRPLEGRSPFVDFQAEGVVTLVSPGKDYFTSNGIKMDLPILSDDIQGSGQRIRVNGGVEISSNGYIYRVVRTEKIK